MVQKLCMARSDDKCNLNLIEHNLYEFTKLSLLRTANTPFCNDHLNMIVLIQPIQCVNQTSVKF